MTSTDILELRHTISTAGEMIVAAILLAAGLIATDWWSIAGFMMCALWVFGAYDEQEKRKRQLGSISSVADDAKSGLS